MRAVKTAALAALAALCVGLLPAQTTPVPKARLEALLDRMSATQRSVKTLKVSFTQTNDFKMLKKPVVLKGDLVLEKPSTALYRYTSPQRLSYLVKDGDLVSLDVDARRLDLKITDAEMEKRRAAWKAPEAKFERGFGALFSRHISQADKGCDFDFLEGTAATADPEIH